MQNFNKGLSAKSITDTEWQEIIKLNIKLPNNYKSIPMDLPDNYPEKVLHKKGKSFNYQLSYDFKKLTDRHLDNIKRYRQDKHNKSIRKADLSVYRLTLNTILTNIFYLKDNWLRCSLHAGDFTDKPFGYKTFKNCIDYLTANKYIDIVLGEECRQTRLKPEPKLIDELKPYKYRPLKPSRESLIILKDKQKKRRDISPADKKKLKPLYDSLEFINECTLKYTYDLPDIDYIPKLTYYRVFNNDSFNQGGRFYGHTFQSLTEDERKTVKIDNKPVVELDFKNYHMNLLRLGENLQIDPTIDSYKLHTFSRDIGKSAFNIALNSQKKKSAVMALRDVQGMSYKDAQKALNELENSNPELKQYFYTLRGLKLQYMDSLICEEIMLNLLKKDIPIISIHDSFISPAENESILRDAMNEAIYNRYNKTIPIERK